MIRKRFSYRVVFTALLGFFPLAGSADGGVHDYLRTSAYTAEHHPEPAEACYWNIPAPMGDASQRDTAPLNIEADTLDVLDKNTWKLSGDVTLKQADMQLSSESLLYKKQQNYGEFSQPVELLDSNSELKAQSGNWFIDSYQGEWNNAEFRAFQNHARGSASRLWVQDQFYSELESASYTTCEPDQDEAWLLKGSKITLDRDTGTGTAKHARLFLLDLPIFYFPYIEFPIDARRKTGVLPPTYRSSEDGYDITVPFYWNIAPNYDMTFYPRHIQFRGSHLGVETRWLTHYFYTTFEGGYIDHDRRANESPRWAQRWDLDTSKAYRWQGRIKWQQVSDDDYLDDFKPQLDQISSAHLEQFVSTSYLGDWWNFSARMEDFQTIEPTLAKASYPYKKQPELLLGASNAFEQWSWQANAGNTHFVHAEETAKDQGQRHWLNMQLSRGIEEAAYSMTPTVGVDAASYQLDRATSNSGLSSNESRLVPFAAFDTTVFFERELQWFNHNLIQTLEPQVFALYVPYRDQQEAPLFDTAVSGEKFDSLFEFNRFTGHDRVGDTQQLSLAVSSRFIDQDSGRQYALAQIGQAHYFDNRKVALGADNINERPYSNIYSKLNLSLPQNITFTAENAWNPDSEHTENYSASLGYRPNAKQLINLSYRSSGYSSTLTESGELTAYWPITNQLQGIAHWHYSFTDEKMLEKFGGLEYSGCCIAIRAIGRSYFESGEPDPRHEYLIQLELIGLGSLGDDLLIFLESNIEGFNRAD